MTYQRGTDIGNCMRDCDHLVSNIVGALSDRPFAHCSAAPADTCPREQAEQPAATWDNPQACWSCGVDSETCAIKGDREPSNPYCSYWKERTNA